MHVIIVFANGKGKRDETRGLGDSAHIELVFPVD